jgi:hypothetical protein
MRPLIRSFKNMHATVRLQMLDGDEIYFRAPRAEIHRLVVRRHGSDPEPGDEHVVTTETDVPISVPWRQIHTIHISS